MRGTDHLVYLDENATATPNKMAVEAAAKWLVSSVGNASSQHRAGRAARAAVEKARKQIATSLDVDARHLTFTASATEGLHTLIGGLCKGGHALVNATEHPAVWGALERFNIPYDIIPVDSFGRIDPSDVLERITSDTRVILLMRAQNELGNIYPVAEVADQISSIPNRPILICDAVQAWGKIPLSFKDLNADFGVVAGHKIGAPVGAAVIWARNGLPFEPLFMGGGQERGRRGGTENVAAIIGMGVAASSIDDRIRLMERCRDQRMILQNRLKQLFPSVQFLGDLNEDTRLPNTLTMRIPNIPGDLLLQILDLEGYAISAGSACSSGALQASKTLIATGLSIDEAREGVRISLGPHITTDLLDQFASILITKVKGFLEK